ncbi:MAG: hypothetical protein ACR5LD_03120 [Symbiopectobacterium sp.]
MPVAPAGTVYGAALLHVQRLLIVGELAFQFIHFLLGSLGTRVVIFELLARFFY